MIGDELLMNDISRKLRKQALYLSHMCQDGNLQSVFSCIDIIWAVYDGVMNWNISLSAADDRDFFIISKGQATLALYPVLIEKGMFNMDVLSAEIGKFSSKYCIQTDVTKFDGGIENSAGSLGHGLPFAVGIAYANKIKKLQSKIFVLCGDGEFCEGTMWESCILAVTKKLDNLCILIDDNNSASAMVDIGSMQQKLEAFGFDVAHVNGHNVQQIENEVNNLLLKENGKPKAVIAKTIRGYGSRTMTENNIWFHKAPSKEELNMLIREVDDFAESIS